MRLEAAACGGKEVDRPPRDSMEQHHHDDIRYDGDNDLSDDQHDHIDHEHDDDRHSHYHDLSNMFAV